MIALIQRVNNASVVVNGNTVASINTGLLVLLGIKNDDTDEDAKYLANKVVNMRIFNDNEGKMNLSLLDIKGECLVVSQFTLHADERKGRRPSFIKAAPPDKAEKLYNIFVNEISQYGINAEKGIFGATMEIHLVNNGPVTIIARSKNEYG